MNAIEFQIMIFLIPGFISSIILNALIVQKEKNKFNLIIEALIFSLFIYVSSALLNQDNPIPSNLYTLISNYKLSFILLGFSLLYSIGLSYLINNDKILNFLRQKNITKRTSRNSVWYDVFYDHKNLIIVNFVDGRRIIGYPLHYSDNPEQPFLYIQKPAWVITNKENKTEYIPLINEHGMLITPEQKIAYIEFLDMPTKNLIG